MSKKKVKTLTRAKHREQIAVPNSASLFVDPVSTSFSEGQSSPTESLPISTMGSTAQKRLRKAANSLEGCSWDGCQTSHGINDSAAHLEGHSRDAIAHWSHQCKCTWKGCKSKAKFKTLRQFNEHLANIHTRPLLCTKPHCSCKTPFKNKHDLERHNSTKHSTERPWECPYDSCSSESRTFARKDKWLKHIRETQHENDAFCPFFHCRLKQLRSGQSFGNRKEIVEHFVSGRHTDGGVEGYACGVGSCAMLGSYDRWTLRGLAEHLNELHKVVIHLWNLELYLEGGDRIVQLQHIPAELVGYLIDCEACASQLEAQHLLSTTTKQADPSETTVYEDSPFLAGGQGLSKISDQQFSAPKSHGRPFLVNSSARGDE